MSPPPYDDGQAAILGKLAQIAERQAVTTERLIALLEKVDDHLERMDADRAKAVETVKGHIASEFDRRDGWWRRFAIIAGVVSTAITSAVVFLTRVLFPNHRG